MSIIFADTFYYLALVNPRDEAHAVVAEFTSDLDTELLTTDWILTDLADALSAPGAREEIARFIAAQRDDPKVTVVPASRSLFDRGLALYAQRRDKAWSLTDCISFTVMHDHGATEALTGDRHFEQAGFVALLSR